MAHPRAVVLEVRAPVSRYDADRLHDAVRRHALDDDAVLVVCRLSGAVDIGVVDALARISLLAGRSGLAVRLRCDSPPLRQLLHLCGLDDVLSTRPATGPPVDAPVVAPPRLCQGPSGRTRGGHR